MGPDVGLWEVSVSALQFFEHARLNRTIRRDARHFQAGAVVVDLDWGVGWTNRV